MPIDFPFLRRMAAVFDGVPAKHIDLNDFLQYGCDPDPDSCGTVACAFGWMAMHPNMKAKGIELRHNGYFRINDELATAIDAGERAFGLEYNDFWRLFNTSIGKAIFRRRIIKFLREHGETSAQCRARGEKP